MKNKIALGLLAWSGFAGAQTMQLQPIDTVSAPTFGEKAYFNRLFFDPTPRIELPEPVKLRDHVVDGKLTLSLRSYLELVMANNTNITLQKVLIQPQRNAIQRAYSIFDPFVTARFQNQRSITPTSNVLDAGANVATLKALNQPLNLGYNQTLSTGAVIQGNFVGTKASNNNANQNFNPLYTTNSGLTITQPLMRGRGADIVKTPIYLAQSRLRTAEYRLEDTVMRLVVAAENAYWDVVGARETLKVQRESLNLAKESLDRARKELELGAISELEIYQPEATYARAQIFVTQAEYRLSQVEDALRLQISADLDSDIRTLPIELTETALPSESEKFDKEALVSEAQRVRPDLKATRQELNVEDSLTLRLTGNAFRPNVSLIGAYTTQGRGGPFLTRGSNVVTPGGVTDALGQMWGFGFPVWSLALQVQLPLRDRRAAADYADAVVAKRVDMMQERQLLQQIRLEVLNAISQVENSRASVEIAKIAADLAQKRVDAEKKRYDLGVTQLFFVLDAQQALTQALSDLVNNSVLYRRNLLNLQQRTGKLLAEKNIVLR